MSETAVANELFERVLDGISPEVRAIVEDGIKAYGKDTATNPSFTDKVKSDRLRKGDSTAATELFALHSARLHLAVRLTFPHELRRLLDEDDIVQAVMIKAMRNLPGFSYTSPGSFRRWLLTIAGNAIRDEIKFHRSARRDHRRAEHLESAADNDGTVGERIAARQTTPSQHAMGNEAVRRLEGGLDALSADDRELLIDHLVIELDLDAIAAKHGRTREAVRVAIHRARARLAAFFDRGS